MHNTTESQITHFLHGNNNNNNKQQPKKKNLSKNYTTLDLSMHFFPPSHRGFCFCSLSFLLPRDLRQRLRWLVIVCSG